MNEESRAVGRESRVQEAGAVSVLPDGPLTVIVRQAETGYPEEICGMVIGQPGAPETYRVRQVTNVANRELQEDPGGQPRDARTAYIMDPLEQLRILREADGQGWDVAVFYHTHPDHEAYFSRMDRERALTPDGEPVWPVATYLVVSVMGGLAWSMVGGAIGYSRNQVYGCFRGRRNMLWHALGVWRSSRVGVLFYTQEDKSQHCLP